MYFRGSLLELITNHQPSMYLKWFIFVKIFEYEKNYMAAYRMVKKNHMMDGLVYY